MSIVVDLIFNKFFVDPPSVELSIKTSHSSQLFETINATLTCNVISGNPRSLDVVYWFFNETSLANQYSCSKFQENCVKNPEILELKAITQASIGNYTCRGKNEAGFSTSSKPKAINTCKFLLILKYLILRFLIKKIFN